MEFKLSSKEKLSVYKQTRKSFEMDLIQTNIERYYLTTDADNNDLTNSFYLKNNFVLYSSFLQGKRRMNLYIKNL